MIRVTALKDGRMTVSCPEYEVYRTGDLAEAVAVLYYCGVEFKDIDDALDLLARTPGHNQVVLGVNKTWCFSRAVDETDLAKVA